MKMCEKYHNTKDICTTKTNALTNAQTHITHRQPKTTAYVFYFVQQRAFSSRRGEECHLAIRPTTKRLRLRCKGNDGEFVPITTRSPGHEMKETKEKKTFRSYDERWRKRSIRAFIETARKTTKKTTTTTRRLRRRVILNSQNHPRRHELRRRNPRWTRTRSTSTRER